MIENPKGLLGYENDLTPELNPETPVVAQEEIPDADFDDKLRDTLYDSAVWGLFRKSAVLRDLPDEHDYKVTQEQIDEVQKKLSGDYDATYWVCSNARSDAQLERLTKMKIEDLERRKRVDNSDIGLDTFGTVIGAVFDPINYVPLFGTAGKVASVSRYLKLAAGNATVNILERGITQNVTGYSQNYVASAILGALGGGVIPFGIDMVNKGFRKGAEAAEQILTDATTMTKHADAVAKGTKAPNQTNNIDDFVADLNKKHDPTFIEVVDDIEVRNAISPERGVFVVSLDDAKKLAASRGIELDELAKGVFDDESGKTFLIKDNLSGAEDLRKTLLHEQGSHGLKYVLPQETYKRILAELRSRLLNNPSDAMKRAVKRAGGDADLEEVLGYLAEELKPSNPLMRNIKKNLDKSLNAMGFKGRLSDEDFVDILTKSSKHYAEGQKGYRVLSDGSCVFNGFHYSKKNLLNPEELSFVDKVITGDNAIKNGLYRVLKWYSKKAAFHATPWSVASESQSPTLQRFIKQMLMNPYMGKSDLGVLPAEYRKSQISRKGMTLWNDYMKARHKALVKFEKLRNAPKQVFNEQVVKAYNAKYANNTSGLLDTKLMDGVEEAVECLHAYREYILEVAQDPKKFVGEGEALLSKDWYKYDDEFYRIMDDSKYIEMFNLFKTEGAFRDFLYKYARAAVKEDVVRQQLEDKFTILWRRESEKAKKLGKELPERQEVTDEILQMELDKQCFEWADGIADRGASQKHAASNSIAKSIDSVDCFKHRLPMDTSVEMMLPNGNAFSFDNNLRSYDLDTFIPLLTNRVSGEIAASSMFVKGGKLSYKNPLGFMDEVDNNFAGQRSLIEGELKQLVNAGKITQSDMQRDLKAFDFARDHLRGVMTSTEAHGYTDALARTLNNLAYARNGGNMTLNQLGEIAGTIAHEGLKAIADVSPAFGKMVTDYRMGKGSEDMVQEAVLETFGDSAQRYTFLNGNSTSSKLFRMAGTDNAWSRAGDVVGGGIKTMGSFVSYVTKFDRLTSNMINSIQKHSIIDLTMWVNGKEFPAYRDPFSDKRLAAVGLGSKTDIDNFRASLKPFLQMNEKGQLIGMDIKGLRSSDPDLFMQYYALLENQTLRCITMPTIGNTVMLKETSPFWRVFFMFKDFTMRSTHSQTLRTLSNGECDDYLAWVYSSMVNTGLVAGLAYGKAWALHSDNENKRKQFLERSLSFENLARSFIVRSSHGSILSPLNDLAEAGGVFDNSIRTTVDRTKFANSDAMTVGKVLTQLPAVDAALDLRDAGLSLADGQITQKDLRQLLELCPMQNFIPMMYLREELVKNSNFPRK